jgi:signal transduction histidine kinase
MGVGAVWRRGARGPCLDLPLPIGAPPALFASFCVWLAGAPCAWAADSGAAGALFALSRVDAQIAVGLAFFVGLVIFSTVTAIRYVRERQAWTARESELLAQVAELRGAADRAEILLGSEMQAVITWRDRDQEPRIEGDAGIAGPGAPFRRVLAFGSWLAPADAGALEAAVERLRERGEGFRLTAATTAGGFIEAEGRSVGAQALLRLRDVSGITLDFLKLQEEGAAAKSELRALRGLLDAVPQPAWLRGGDGRLSWVNKAYCAAVEAGDAEEVRSRSLELLDRSDRERADRRRRDNESFRARVAAIMAGQRRVLDVFEAPLFGASGGIAVDVSELEDVRADQDRQMQAHVRTLDQLPTAVAMFDARQRLRFHNAAYRRLWGLEKSFLDCGPSDGEVLDRLRTLGRLPEEADFRIWKAGVLDAYRLVEPQETWWHLPDRRTLRVVTNPNPKGGVTYLYDDVSEAMHLESRLNTLNRVQRETLDTLTEGVVLFGSDGRMKLSNRAFRQMWRLGSDVSDEPHVEAVIAACVPLATENGIWAEIRGAVAGLPEMRIGFHSRMTRRDGSVLECALQPLPDGATLLTFIDVTASVNVERALTERNDALQRAARLRNDFVHHVSYELRSPLTNIIGFTQLLGDETVGPLNPRQREYAEHIMGSSGALLAIINDILDLASIDNDEIGLEPEDVDIRETIESAARGIEDRLVEASLTLEIDVPPGIGSFVADRRRIRQILFNLLSNAAGFSTPGQTIRVGARKRDHQVVIQVVDHGRGIPQEVQDRVFDRFESHTRGTRHRGAGLGLSIVRSFVELHGGTVDLASAPGLGTTVTCTFPARGAARQHAAA